MADAEGTLDHGGNYSFMRNFTPKPLPTIEVRFLNLLCFGLSQTACVLVIPLLHNRHATCPAGCCQLSS
jgi:hypothetical protein